MNGREKNVAVIVPTYNEAENIPALSRRLSALDIENLRLIIVDDNSPDGTADVAKSVESEFKGSIDVISRESKQGLGTAYIAGFSHALDQDADFIIQMDADLSHSPEYIPAFLEELSDNDVVVGSRYIKGGGVDKSWTLKRRLLSSWGNIFIRSITGVKVKDVTSGFKAYRRDALGKLDFSSF